MSVGWTSKWCIYSHVLGYTSAMQQVVLFLVLFKKNSIPDFFSEIYTFNACVTNFVGLPLSKSLNSWEVGQDYFIF